MRLGWDVNLFVSLSAANFSMSIVLFVIGLNLSLAIGLLWVARQVFQWRRSLKRLNRSLQVAQQTIPPYLSDPVSSSTPTLLTQYQHLEAQLLPLFSGSAKTFTGFQRAHWLWRVTMKKRRGF